MNWTLEAPTKPGFYWWLSPSRTKPTVAQVELEYVPGSPEQVLKTYLFGAGWSYNGGELGGLWLGPVELPTVPDRLSNSA